MLSKTSADETRRSTSRPAWPARRALLTTLAGLLPLMGCRFETAQEVVVYTAHDREFSAPILDEFREQTGIVALTKYDTESTKTVGLAEAILAERARPRCDVFWNNEILHTLRLDEAGLLAPLSPTNANDFPAMYRSPNGTWFGFAARARVLIVNTELVPEEDRPRSVRDLADPRWQGTCGLAKPLFGTTATHAACLFELWGEAEAREFFAQVEQNALVESGNKQVALSVGAGRLKFGLTDTDDAIAEVEKGMPVVIIYPDQGEGELGTLFIPNTVAAIKGGPHPEAALKLVDFLLTPAVEQQLAEGPSAQFPLNTRVKVRPRVEPADDVRQMEVDFTAAARGWNDAAAVLREIFGGP